MALACVGSRAPSLWLPEAAQSYRQAHPPHDGPASVGLGAKPGASFPVGEGQLDSQRVGCQDGSTCAAQGWPQGGLCSGPALRASLQGAALLVTGQAAARPVSCHTGSAGDVYSLSPRMNKRLETSCGCVTPPCASWQRACARGPCTAGHSVQLVGRCPRCTQRHGPKAAEC